MLPGALYTPPSGGKSGITLIQEQVLGSAASNITFSSIPNTYRHLKLIALLASSRAANNDALLLRLNGDSGANYAANTEYTAGNTTGFAGGFVGAALTSLGAAQVCVPAANGTAHAPGVLEADFFYYANTTWWKSCKLTLCNLDSSLGLQSNVFSEIVLNGGWRNTAAINAIALTLNTGPNFIAGSIASLYGIS